MTEIIRKSDIEEFINDLASNHPEYTMEQFKKDFRTVISRDPRFSETRIFQKAVKEIKSSQSMLTISESSQSSPKIFPPKSASLSSSSSNTQSYNLGSSSSNNYAPYTSSFEGKLSADSDEWKPSLDSNAGKLYFDNYGGYSAPLERKSAYYYPYGKQSSDSSASYYPSSRGDISFTPSYSTSGRNYGSHLNYSSTSNSTSQGDYLTTLDSPSRGVYGYDKSGHESPGWYQSVFRSASPSAFNDKADKDSTSVFHQNPKGGYTLTLTPEGEVCTFTCGGYRTIFLKTLISEGIFRWTVRIRYSLERRCLFGLGAAPSHLLSRCEADNFGRITSTVAFTFWLDPDCSLKSALIGVSGELTIPQTETEVPDEALVTVEVDAEKRTMCFFVNDKKVPRAISDMYLPLYLGVSGCFNPSFTSVSFCRVTSPTHSTVGCRFYACEV